MARKGNRKKGASGSEAASQQVSYCEDLADGTASDMPNGERVIKCHVVDDKKSKQKSRKSSLKEKQDTDATRIKDLPILRDSNAVDNNKSTFEDLNSARGNDAHVDPLYSPVNSNNSSSQPLYGLQSNGAAEALEFSSAMVIEFLRTTAVSISKASHKSLERLAPLFGTLATMLRNFSDYVWRNIVLASPIVFRWIMHIGNIVVLLMVVWLDCALRGVSSFVHMGTTSFFSVVWCSTFLIVAMIGMFKFLISLALTAVVGLFIGFTIALFLVSICGVVLLWFYGSFWTTLLIVFLGGLSYLLKHERLALLFLTLYSVYSAWCYVGWLGVILALNLSFVSSDVLIYFVRKNMNESRRYSEQTSGIRGQPGFVSGESVHASFVETDGGLATDRTSGIPSTSGLETEITSEDEVDRLLNCSDHYSALGLSRFESVDVSILKREYRKKAMLVHPDKNMGNEKAAEAFKKLQNAYEVLLDSFKRKAYDDELRSEELLNYIRRFQSTSQKSRRHGFFGSAFARTDSEDEDIPGESRRIACRKCGNFHVWVYTKKSKSKARYCQECKDYHSAKDGDGWVEQSSQPFLFGIMQKVEAPAAYVCADSRIYNATEWYICQGMRCHVNTHKASFHVNTNVNMKQNSGKGTGSGQRGGTPKANMEETATEEEFFEWLQNAVQAGMFENFPGSTSESPSTHGGNNPKSSSGSSNSKRKKKGKKQW